MVISAGLFLINKHNEILICHPTGGNHWSIPKGKIEDGESMLEAAIRETFEETNFTVTDNINYQYIGEGKYKGRSKYLHTFSIREVDNPHLSFNQKIKCNSFIPSDRKWNAGKPENDKHQWAPISIAEELLHYIQIEHLQKVKELLFSKS
jgi:8-oxo-dGTP pyrophosphatase MutT (NUDIX family)